MGRKRARKTTKERQDARPFAHKNGLWAKKCRGRFIYLGSVAADPTGETAWARWLDERDDWRAGRVHIALILRWRGAKDVDANLAILLRPWQKIRPAALEDFFVFQCCVAFYVRSSLVAMIVAT